MNWRSVSLASVPPQPWKNGGGTTRELLAWPAGADWRVRLSVAEVVAEEWGNGLIGSWNTAGWIDLPRRVGGKIAQLIGAPAEHVVATDSTSVNLFKVMSAALGLRPGDAAHAVLKSMSVARDHIAGAPADG